MTTEQRLARKKKLAVQALCRYPTIEKAAQAAQIKEDTLSDWLREPDFLAAYELASRQAELVGLRAGRVIAVRTLNEIMTNRAAAPGARVTACHVSLGRRDDLDAISQALAPETTSEQRIRHMEAELMAMTAEKARRMGIPLAEVLESAPDAQVLLTLSERVDKRMALEDAEREKGTEN